MNTSGLIRGYMAKNMKTEEFMQMVISALNMEFDDIMEGVILKTTGNKFIIRMEEYEVILEKEFAEKIKSPYGIDKYILDEFEKQGFKPDKNRSQYIQYCNGNYVGAEII